jgi:hypothetical protein
MDFLGYVYPHPVKAKHGEPLYQFNLGIITAMFLVGVGCRDKATRDSTAPLLNLNKEYREGMWGAGSAGTIVSWLREVEDGMRDENGEIADESRAFVTEAHLNKPHRRAIIKLSQRSNEGVVTVVYGHLLVMEARKIKNKTKKWPYPIYKQENIFTPTT